MKKLLRILAALMLAQLLARAHGQAVTCMATNLTDGNAAANGTIFFKPVLSAGQPASYEKPGGGIASIVPISAPVTAGAFSMDCPNTALTSPANICFSVTMFTVNGSVLGPGYTCAQPHYTASGSGDWCQAGVCDFDNLAPNVAAQPLLAASVVSSINGASGSFILSGPGFSGCSLSDGAYTCTFSAASAGGSSGQLQFNNGTGLGGTAFSYDPTGLVNSDCGGFPCIYSIGSTVVAINSTGVTVDSPGNSTASVNPSYVAVLSDTGSAFAVIQLGSLALGGTAGGATTLQVTADGQSFVTQQGIATGTSSNTDLAGMMTASAGTASYAFAETTFTIAPVCAVNDDTNPSGLLTKAVTTTQMSAPYSWTLTVTTSGATDSVSYICHGRN